MHLPEQRADHLADGHIHALGPPVVGQLGVGAWQRRVGLGRHFEPGHFAAPQTLAVWHFQGVELQRQRRPHQVARGLDHLTAGGLLAQRIGTFDAAHQAHFSGDADAQKLGPVRLASHHRHPQQQLLDLVIFKRQLGGHQGAQAYTQEGVAAVAMLTQPGDAQLQVSTPTGPVRLVKLAQAVAGTAHVQHQGADAQRRKGLGLQRHHRPAAVHLLGKRRHHQHIAFDKHPGFGRMVEPDERAEPALQQDGTKLAGGFNGVHGNTKLQPGSGLFSWGGSIADATSHQPGASTGKAAGGRAVVHCKLSFVS